MPTRFQRGRPIRRRLAAAGPPVQPEANKGWLSRSLSGDACLPQLPPIIIAPSVNKH